MGCVGHYGEVVCKEKDIVQNVAKALEQYGVQDSCCSNVSVRESQILPPAPVRTKEGCKFGSLWCKAVGGADGLIDPLCDI